jgi:hypothetical protein
MMELILVKISRHIAEPDHVNGEKYRDGEQIELQPENCVHRKYLL